MSETVYEYRKTGYGDCEECECCGWQAPVALFNGIAGVEPDRWLCEVCSSTLISRLLLHPRENGDLFRVIAETANLLLDKLTGRNP